MGRFCVGTLDSKVGWETQSVESAISRHVTYWFVSRNNQGKIIGDVPSFYYLFQKYSSIPEEMITQTRDQFKAYLEELFDNVVIETGRQDHEGSPNNYNLNIAGMVVVDGIKYDIAETVIVTGEYYKILTAERFKR